MEKELQEGDAAQYLYRRLHRQCKWRYQSNPVRINLYTGLTENNSFMTSGARKLLFCVVIKITPIMFFTGVVTGNLHYKRAARCFRTALFTLHGSVKKDILCFA